MLSDEKIDKESWDESSIKLKVMEETERKMLINFFKEIDILMEKGYFSPLQGEKLKQVMDKLQDEFNDRWFKG